jgi:protein phosphatase
MAGMRFRVGARTHVGRVRRLNEDVYLLQAKQGLFVVCDGIGGGPSGELASRVAGDTIIARLAPGKGVAGSVSAGQLQGGYLPRTSMLADAVRCSNKRVYNRARKNRRHAGMGTTVVSAWIAENVASIAHVGDSRAYLWYGGRLVALTCDHSLASANANEQEDALVRALGREPNVDVDLTEVPVRSGDYLVLCSDGLTRMVSESVMARVIRELRDPQRICDRLVDIANGNGGVDNITVVVVQVLGSWWQRLSTWTPLAGGIPNAEAHPAG